MNEYEFFDVINQPNHAQRNEIADFLFTHLDQFGDSKNDIHQAIAYALKENGSVGGFVLRMNENNETTCIAVINKTGMSGYIPEYILVYIATHKNHRGKGIGKKMMQKIVNQCDGSIALHVEPNNPAKYLYEKIGFTNKYLEMRYIKQ